MTAKDTQMALIMVKHTYALMSIRYICEQLKKHNKRKIDIDAILRITKSVLESEEE